MPRFVVLLRGVNVGGGNRVPMAEFKRMLEKLGHTEVQTLLNSGNAVFASPGRSGTRHAAAIGAALRQKLGVSTPVIVKTAAEFAAVIKDNPMVPPEADHSRFLVAFGQAESALRSLDALAPLATHPEKFVVTGRAAFLYCPMGSLKSKVGAAMLGKAGREVTTRNWATVLKLGALLDAI